MNTRILSPVVGLGIACATITTTLFTFQSIQAADAAGYYTDPATGIVYRQVTKTVETARQRDQDRNARTNDSSDPKRSPNQTGDAEPSYTPVVEYQWEPRLEGRWNPFRQPAVAYRHVPRTHWQAEQQVINRFADANRMGCRNTFSRRTRNVCTNRTRTKN